MSSKNLHIISFVQVFAPLLLADPDDDQDGYDLGGPASLGSRTRSRTCIANLCATTIKIFKYNITSDKSARSLAARFGSTASLIDFTTRSDLHACPAEVRAP